MDRMRGNRPARRRTQPAFNTSFDSLDTNFAGDSQSPSSPTMPFAHQTPQTAPANHRRGARQTSIPGTQSFSLASSPTATKGMSLRKRARIFGVDGAADEEDEPNKKGSHNLRKRAKIDYAAHDFEDEVPEIAMAAPRTATRKKSETFSDEITPRRRAASREISVAEAGPSSRRKTPARRATEQGFTMYLPPSDDVVKDTIEVVGDSSDLHNSDDVSEHDDSPVASEPQIKQQQSSPIEERQAAFFTEPQSLPSPIPSTQASEKPEIAHPQPIHINHVSLITEPSVQADEPVSSQQYPPSETSHSIIIASPPAAPKAPEEHVPVPVASPVHVDRPQEAEAPKEESETTAAAPAYSWSHLTPYLEGEVVLHPEPSTQPGAAEDEDDEGDDEADEEEAPENGLPTEKSLEEEANGDEGSRTATSTPQTPRRGTPAPSNGVTGSNTPILSDKIAALSKGAAVRRRKQFRFRKLRDPADFQEYLQNHKDMSTEELWALLAHANETLVAWQDEWQDCGRKVDDYENAKRRAQQDAEYEKKTADLGQFTRFESYLEKDFELRGYRAPIKEKEEGVHQQRWQDRVMASAYGFEYDPHVSKIGNQDPVAQREGIMAGRQLRSQPQQTAKAAEAGEGGDGLVVIGKRTRNPPKLYEGLLQDDNRSATPADVNNAAAAKPPPKRRGRPPLSAQQPVEEQAPKKRGPRGRKSEAAVDTDAETPAAEVVAPTPKRRRGRQPKSAQTISQADLEDDDINAEEAEAALSDEASTKRARATRRRGKPDLSFLKRNSSSHMDLDTEEETRPTTSSSNATMSDNGSTYGTRPNKRTRTQKDDAEPEETQPQRKRPRINLKQSGRPGARSEQILATLANRPKMMIVRPMHTLTFSHQGFDRWRISGEGIDGWTLPGDDSTPPLSARPSAVPSIPPSAPPSTVSSAAPSQAGGDDSVKDYSTMTKSEKMSASMKKRWMNGSMQNAVNKRKATLAAKKAAAAAAAAASATVPTPPPPVQAVAQAPPPQRLHPFINMNGQQGRFQ